MIQRRTLIATAGLEPKHFRHSLVLPVGPFATMLCHSRRRAFGIWQEPDTPADGVVVEGVLIHPLPDRARRKAQDERQPDHAPVDREP